jgi:rhodanese-related sulfurtransferase
MESNEVPRINCEEVKQLFDRDEKVVIIDTREYGSYQDEHIEGAVNIFYNPLGDPLEREIILTALPADSLLVFYCE